MQPKYTGILITGSSHTGKSTMAAALAEKLGCKTLHTDEMARHPGRPWPTPKPQVAEFYSTLSADTIFWFLRAHYENFQFQIHQLIDQNIAAETPFILEGSAIRPALLQFDAEVPVRKICLTANADILRDRIRASCDWDNQSPAAREAIDAFTSRTIMDNAELVQTAGANGFEIIETDSDLSISQIALQF